MRVVQVVGDRHGCISKQEGQNAEFRKRNRSKDNAGKSRVGDRSNCISRQRGQNAEFRKRNRSYDMQVGQGQGTGMVYQQTGRAECRVQKAEQI
jgi:hypothetical protein